MEQKAEYSFLQRIAWTATGAAFLSACLDATTLPNAILCCLCFNVLAFVLLIVHRLLPAQMPAGLRIICYSPAGALVYVLAARMGSWLSTLLSFEHPFSFLIYWVFAAISLIQALPTDSEASRTDNIRRFLSMLCLTNAVTLLVGLVHHLFAEDGERLVNGTYALMFLFSLHPLLGCVLRYARGKAQGRTSADPFTMGLMLAVFAPMVSLLHWLIDRSLGSFLAESSLSADFRYELLRSVMLIGLCVLYLAAAFLCSMIGGKLLKNIRPYLMCSIFSCAMMGVCSFVTPPNWWESVLKGLNIGLCYAGFAFFLWIAVPLLMDRPIPKALRGGPAMIAYSIVLLLILSCLGL